VRKELEDLALSLQQKWDDTGFEKLWDLLDGKATCMVRHYRISGMSEDDIRQELMIDMVQCVRTWDPKRGRNFDNWVELRWRGEMGTLISRSHNLRNEALTSARSFSEIIDISGGDEEKFGTTIERETTIGEKCDVDQKDRVDEFRWRLMILMRDLTKRERQVIWLYHRGLHFNEIAPRLGISEKSVDNAVRRCRVKSQHLAQGKWRYLSMDDSRKRMF
jgi:RNA polymerase sporulation-specific sigma factor